MGWKLPMREIVTVAPRCEDVDVVGVVRERLRSEGLSEVTAAYRRASEPATVGASR